MLRAAGNETILCAAELTGLSFQKLPLHMPLVQILKVKMFISWEVVQIFQSESIFCSEISSGGSLIIEIGWSIFTMTGTQTQMLLPKLHSYA